jgi:hypothetical protein
LNVLAYELIALSYQILGAECFVTKLKREINC